MRAHRSVVLPIVLLLVIAAALSACGGQDAVDQAAEATGPEHVHGLGINPGDGSLYVATHTGLFRMEPGSNGLARVGDRLQDTMGFAVVGPNRFIGSGHPDLRDDLPPLLGLIESSDAGRSWEPVSLLGEADFHALSSDGARVTGYDASGARVMVSADSGRTWRSAAAPAPLGGLAVDPKDPDRLVATSEAGLLASPDAGRTWRDIGGDPALLAWAAPDALYGFTTYGEVRVSPDGGESWSARGTLDREPAAVTATEGALIVALHDGSFARSDDGGRSWSEGPWG